MVFTKLKSTKKMFWWDGIFKPLATAILMYLNQRINYYKSDFPIPTRYKNITLIISNIINRHKFGCWTKKRLSCLANILMHFLSVDSAYTIAFDEFVKYYYEINHLERLNIENGSSKKKIIKK